MRLSAIALATLALLLACTGTNPDPNDGVVDSGAPPVRYAIEGALLCDPNADAFDDVFYFGVAIEPQPDEVVGWFQPGNRRVDLDYDAPADVWDAEVWADDLDADCDYVTSYGADYAAYADGEEVATTSADAEMY